MSFKRTVIIGDFHSPFFHRKAAEACIAFIKDFKPTRVIQVGDLEDQYSFSRYPRSLNIYTPQEERKLAREGTEWLWSSVQKSAPGAKCYQLLGNHDMRMHKQLTLALPEMEGLVDWKPIYSFPGVKTFFDPQEEVVFDGVLYQHGHRKFSEHCKFNQMNTITGHLHRGGLHYEQNINGAFFELNVAWLGDVTHRVFGYRAQKYIHKTTLGWGAIDEYGPRFIHWGAK